MYTPINCMSLCLSLSSAWHQHHPQDTWWMDEFHVWDALYTAKTQLPYHPQKNMFPL